MPDFGQRSSVDLITGGFKDLGEQGMRADAEAKKEAELNRVLHPANQKWIEAIRSGRMSPVEAAVAAHQEHDMLGTPHVNTPPQQGMAPPPSAGVAPGAVPVGAQEDPSFPAPERTMSVDMPPQSAEPQIQGSQVASRGGMTSAAPSYGPRGNGGRGGLTAPAERPYTVRDLNDAEAISKMQRPDTVETAKVRGEAAVRAAIARGASAEEVARIRGEFGLQREDKKGDRADKDRKERARQFDGMLQWRYDSLREDMDKVRESLRSRESIASGGQSDKSAIEMIKMDVETLNKVQTEIDRLQNELVRAQSVAVGSQDDDLIHESKQKIADLQRERDDLKRSVDSDMRHHGGRSGIPETPGTQYAPPPGSQGPAYRPNQLPGAQPRGQGGPPPPIQQGADVREPKTITLRDRATGRVKTVPAAVAEAAIRDVGQEKFMSLYEIAGSADEQTDDSVSIPPR